MEYIHPGRIEKTYPTNFRKSYKENNRIILETENAKLELSVYSESIIRFRYTPGRFEQDFSYAVNPGFNPKDNGFDLEESENDIIISTHKLKIYVTKNDLKVSIFDDKNRLINEDANGFHWEKNPAYGGNYVYCSKAMQKNESFYGLGDKTTDLNLRGKRLINWCTEFYGYHKNIDPLYKAIPFYYGLHNSTAYGIFFDNSFKSFFDFGHENHNIVSFWAEGGEMNYFFIYGPELTEVAEKYTLITGVPEMPPLWALGYHQSKWSYYPDSMVREIAHQFRKRQIPCDVIHFDIDYMNGFRCFTWDKDRFPDPKGLLNDLEKEGFKAVAIIDPGIKIDPEYRVYKEGAANRYFCRRPDGDFVAGKVWPGECHFPDFTNPEVRDWWASLFKELVNDGVDGVWNDMNEPSIFEITTFPNDVRHNHEGLKVSHRRGHNVYGMQMARSTYEGMKKNNPEKRPFVITRAGYAGVQRFSSVWTGDNVSNWEHIWMANIQCQRLSISGISFCGSDIGGFLGEPNGELFLRYIQLALFHPFFRAHSSSDQGDKEPWAFGKKFETLIRAVIELRYRLLPYLYTAFYEYIKKGTPILRSLVFLDQEDDHTHNRMDEFICGEHILACPIREPGATGRWMYMPKGNWIHYFTHEKFEGGNDTFIKCELNNFPFLVREGAIIPHYPVMQFTGEKKIDEVELQIFGFSNKDIISFLYEDDGEGYSYTNGNYVKRKFITQRDNNYYKIIQETEGNFRASYTEFKINLIHLPFNPSHIYVDDKEVQIKNYEDGTITFNIPDNFRVITVSDNNN